MTGRVVWTGYRALAVAAVVLGIGAAASGSPYRLSPEALDPGALMAPVELARMIVARDSGLRLIDLRDAAAFDAFSIPTARSVGPSELADVEWDRHGTIVVYDDRDADAARARETLVGRGYDQVYVLAGGLTGWLNDVINAWSPEGAPAADREAFREVAALSRYFGGTPRSNVPAAEPEDADRAAQRVRRRGCAL